MSKIDGPNWIFIIATAIFVVIVFIAVLNG